MNEAQAVEAICEHWESEWEALHPDDPDDPDNIPYVFDNEVFTAKTTWARVSVIHTQQSRQATMGPVGARKFDRGGNIAVQLFVVADQGGFALSTLADEVREIFEGVRLTVNGDTEALHTYAGTTTNPRVDGPWHTCTVLSQFRYYDTK